MITNDDVLLSKLSYTDADFAELYPDLLDLAKQLTNKWDPSLSNESDPGVVLLKHAAFIGDHNNYNTDKNTLEAFLPTATQDISVRNIVEMNGYTPRYYISASGNISFTYKGDYDKNFVIPAFTIVVSNEDGTVAYTQIEDLSITGKDITSTALFMEGTVQQLSINNASKITMENINSDYRIYFPNSYVAQNGVFIKNVGDSVFNTWTRDNYLLTQPKGEKRYKVDYDSSKNLPYIEFPSDIANLIGDGLIINYISTSGLSGNIGARTLNTVQSPDKYTFKSSTDSVDMSDFDVFNSSSITNGKDPETINEMYNSFKKVVGTFNTLVTCLDYSNALYNAEDAYNNNILGNVSVTDIRNDYNKAANLVTYDEYGVWYKNVSLGEAIISAYNFNFLNSTKTNLETSPAAPTVVTTSYNSTTGDFTIPGSANNSFNLANSHYYDIYINDSETSYGKYLSPYNIQTSSGSWIINIGAGLSSPTVKFKLYPNPGDIKSASNVSGGIAYYTYNNEWKSLNDLTELDFTSYINGLSPFDLVVHALKAYSSSNYTSFDPYYAISESFIKPSDDVIKGAVKNIESLQCINHTFEYPDVNSKDSVYIFKNYAPVRCLITPYNKLSRLEKYELINTIYKTLSDKYNSREVDWGEAINEEVLQNDILNSDDRIRSVKLEPIEYVPTSVKFSAGTGGAIKFDEIPVESDTDIMTDLVAKNFLAGRICLFDFDDTFEYRYGQQVSQLESGVGSLPSVIKGITSITTELQISQSSGDTVNNIISYVGIKDGDYKEGGSSSSTWDTESVTISPESTVALTEDYGIAIKFEGGNSFIPISDPEKILIIENNSETTITLNSTVVESVNISKINFYFKDADNYLPIVIDDQGASISGTSYDYTLQNNEYFIIKHKNYSATKSYSTGVTYIFKSNEETTIPSNTFYRLKAGERIQFIYTNSNDVLIEDLYTENDCIRSTFDIKDIDHFKGFKQKVTNSTGNSIECCSVPSGNRISICEPLTTVIDNNSVKCCWVLNTDGNILFEGDKLIRDLEQGEYFIYATKSESQMVIFGSGTRIERSSKDDGYSWACNKPNISAITSNGFKADLDWKEYNFLNENLNISEFEIITLGPGSKFTLNQMPKNNSASIVKSLSGDWAEYNGSILYETEDGQTTLNAGSDPYYIRTRLDISTSNDNPQKILKTDSTDNKSNGLQKVVLNTDTNEYILEPASTDDSIYFQTNQNLELIGGSNISILNDNLAAYNYSIINPTYEEYNDTSEEWVPYPKGIKAGTNGYQITINNKKARCSLPFQYSVTQNSQEQDIKQYILPLYVTSSLTEGNNIEVKLSDSDKIANITSGGSNFATLPKWNSTYGSYNYTTKETEDEKTIIDKITVLTKTGLNSDLTPSITTKLNKNSVYSLYLMSETSSAPTENSINIQFNTGDMESNVEIDVSNLLIEVPDSDSIDYVLLGDAYQWEIGEFNGSSDSSYIIDKPGMYLMLITRTSGVSPVFLTSDEELHKNINILADLSLDVSWEKIERSGAVSALNPVVINGLNINLSNYTTMEAVLGRISDIVKHSSAPDTKIYYINKPDNDLAIENDEVLNLFDKNNVANPITIAQIDFENHNSYIDVVKSMMKE